MPAQAIDALLRCLNELLVPDQKFQNLSYAFSTIADQLTNCGIRFLVEEIEPSYNDDELNAIITARRKAFAKKAFKIASILQQQEQELLDRKIRNRNFRSQASLPFFESRGEVIIAHLDLKNANQQLLKKLIEEIDPTSGIVKKTAWERVGAYTISAQHHYL